MTTRRSTANVVFLGGFALAAVSCTGVNPLFSDGGSTGESTTAGSSGEPPAATTGTGPETTVGTTLSSTSSTSDDTTGATSDDTTGGMETESADVSSFIDGTTGCLAELPGGVLAHCTADCSVWEEGECANGQACKAWANDGGTEWNDSLCRPLDPAPAVVGDPCEVEGNAASGIDTCVEGAMCWNVPPGSVEGTCVAYCDGTPEAATCMSPENACVILFGGWVPLCLTQCDPIPGNCTEGTVCSPADGGAFVCLDDEMAACPQGSVDAPPGLFDSCKDDPCCVAFCDGSDDCAGDEVCVDFSESPAAGYEDVRICVPDL